MQNSYFFACGTPSDREGFTYKCLNELSLPGIPASYLDRITDIGPEGVFTVDLISVDTVRFALFTEYRAIQPSDRAYNRGAYIAAGFLSPPEAGIHRLSNGIALTREILGALISKLDERGAFPKDFKLSEFSYPISQSCMDGVSPYLLADLVFQASNRQGTFSFESGRVVLNPSDANLNATLGSLSFYSRPENDRLVERFRTEADSARQLAKEAAQRLEEADKKLELHSRLVQGMKEDLAKYKEEREDLERLKRASNERATDLEERFKSYSVAPETNATLGYDRSSIVGKPNQVYATAAPRRSVERAIEPLANIRGSARSEKSTPHYRNKAQKAKAVRVNRESILSRAGDWRIMSTIVVVLTLLVTLGFLFKDSKFWDFGQPETENGEKSLADETPRPNSDGNTGDGDTAKDQDTKSNLAEQRLKGVGGDR